MKPPDDAESQLRALEATISSATLNLMSTAERVRISLHIAESEQLSSRIGRGFGSLVDVGSGAGLPGLVLAVCGVAEQVHLVESVQRKANFLASTAQALGLEDRVVVHSARSESLSMEGAPLRDAADVVVGRAVAAPVTALELLAPLARPGGEVVYMSTNEAAGRAMSQLAAAATALNLATPTLEAFPSELRSDGVLIRAGKTGPTPERFPRRTGLARTRPLA